MKSRAESAGLRSDWNQLLADSTVNSLFMTWEWIDAWLDSCSKSELFIIVVKNEQKQILGIAPFYKARFSLFNLFSLNVLRIIGDEGTGGEYPAIIVDKKYSSEIFPLILSTLLEHSQEWHLMWLPRMSGWDRFNEIFSEYIVRAKLSLRKRPRSFSHFHLPKKFTDFESALSTNRRQQFRRQSKKIYALNNVEIVVCNTEESLPVYLQSLFDLHSARRKLLGDIGTFKRKPQQIDFYRHFARAALANNWLRFYAMKQNKQIKAIQLGYVYNGIFYQIQEGFEPDFPAGAGNILRMEVVRQCIEQGVSEFDFLGEHTEHKRRWTSVERFGWDMLIGNSRILSKLVMKKPFWPTGRFLRPIGDNSKSGGNV